MSDLIQPDLPDSPYPGIDPFGYKDRNVFFARAAEIEALARLIVLYRGVLLYSDSGTGKSSLINAGIIPRAVEEGYQAERIRIQPQPGREIVIQLSERVRNATIPYPSIFAPDNIADYANIEADQYIPRGGVLPATIGSLVLSVEEFVRRLRQYSGGLRPLLVFDQFEEWVTLFEQAAEGDAAMAAKQSQEEIRNAICIIINDTKLPVKVLLTLREDYLAKLAPFFQKCPNLPDQYLRLVALKGNQVYQAIRGPFKKYPGQFRPEISEGLAKKIQEQFESRSSGTDIRLTEVQIVCRDLFESGSDGPAKVFDGSGGVQGILEHYLESSVQSLESDQRGPAVALLSRMITSAGTRNVISEADLRARVNIEDRIELPLLEQTLESLEQKVKLVRRELRREVYYYEIASEFLVPWIWKKTQDRQTEEVKKKAAAGVGHIITGVIGGPVRDQPGDPQQPSDGTALCMSGTGYRATLFHLGVLWRLNELQYLSKLDRVSSVSGGSITSGVLALNWEKLGFDADGCAQNFDQQVTQPIRNLASRSVDVRSILESVFGGISKHIADHYNEFLYHHATLQQLPDAPRFVINATSLQTGQLWRFTKPFMGDWKVGLVKNPDVELATAVAASSAFPPLLSPCVLHLDPNSFDPAIPPAPGIQLSDLRRQIVLADGGLYDNLGLETTWKTNKTILVSNGGGALTLDVDPKHDWLSQANRALNIISSQVVSLRTRSVVELFKLGVRNGSYWGIGSNIKNYQLPDALVCPLDVTTKLAETATGLTAIDNKLQEQLIDWGYAVCDAGMRKRVLPGAPAPTQSPYGTFKKA